MDITTAVAALAALEAGLTITSPVATGVKRVFTFPPNRQQALTEAPCWVNTWSLVRVEWTQSGTTANRQEFYTVTSQLFVQDADLNRGAAIASAFLPAFLSAIGADFTLGGTCLFADARGGDPTLGLLEWAGQGYPGLTLLIDLEIRNP